MNRRGRQTPAARPTRTSDSEGASDLGLERIVFFSDAVMAIAITLLAVDIQVPEISRLAAARDLPRRLGELNPQIMSFVISFVVIGIYWMAHHRYFALIRRYDEGLLMINLLFLLFVAVIPFIASLLGRYPFLPLGVIPYAVDVAAIGISISALWAYATHSRRLVDPGTDARQIRLLTGRPLAPTVVFVLSVPIALFNPTLVTFSWLLAPLAVVAVNRLANPGTSVQARSTE